MQQETLRELWDCELKILDEVDKICRRHNLQYYLMWGTLIGAVRHGGFIPWDDDIDISMPRKDYNKFLRIARKELSNDFFVQTGLTDKFHPMFFAKIRLNNTAFYATKNKNHKKHHGIFIDIIPLDERPKELNRFQVIKKKVAGRLTDYIFKKREGALGGDFSIFSLFPVKFLIRIRDRLMTGKGRYYISFNYVFKKEDFYPAMEMGFEGRKYFGPNNYDKILTTIYGDYMQLPSEDKRIAHEPAFISFDTKKDSEKLKKYLENFNAE